VFKSKGADRKNKTDRERIAKQPDSSLYFQPSYDCTLLTTYNEDNTPLRTTSSVNNKEKNPSPNITSSQSTPDLSLSSVQLNVATSSTNYYHLPQSTIVNIFLVLFLMSFEFDLLFLILFYLI